MNINTVTRAMGDTGGFQVYVQGGELTSPDAIEWMYKWGAHKLALLQHTVYECFQYCDRDCGEEWRCLIEADKASYIKDGSQVVISFGMKSLSEAQQRSLVVEVTADVQFFAHRVLRRL